MPTYEYVCTSCQHEFEAFQSMKDDPLTECPSCENGTVRRKIGRGAGIIFKGGGFYETDFKDKKGTKPSENSEKPRSDSGSSDAKPAAKTETASTGSSGAKPGAAAD